MMISVNTVKEGCLSLQNNQYAAPGYIGVHGVGAKQIATLKRIPVLPPVSKETQTIPEDKAGCIVRSLASLHLVDSQQWYSCLCFRQMSVIKNKKFHTRNNILALRLSLHMLRLENASYILLSTIVHKQTCTFA